MSPAFLARRWKPGQSGNPSGQAAEYGEVVQLARSLSIRAVERLGELMESEDERVAAVAANAILDRAFGKAPQQRRDEDGSFEERYRRMTPEERCRDAEELAAQVKALLARRRAVDIDGETAEVERAGGSRMTKPLAAAEARHGPTRT